MQEREQSREIIERGELFFLTHQSSENIFSGYGLTMKNGSKEHLVGLLMIDRPQKSVGSWLDRVEEAFGEYELMTMTETGDRGILCQMQIDHISQHLLSEYSTP